MKLKESFGRWMIGKYLQNIYIFEMGFPGGSDSKESAYNVGDPGSVPGLGRAPGEGNGYPVQHSCLENPMDRKAWRPTVRGVTKSHRQITYTHTHTHTHTHTAVSECLVHTLWNVSLSTFLTLWHVHIHSAFVG